MPIAITVPRLGWNMEEGTFIEWIKAEGDTIRPGESLYRLEGEKSVEDVECLDSGVLHIPPDAPQRGSRVTVGATIAYLLQPGEARPSTRLVQPAPGAGPETTPPVPLEPAASPAVRRMARERGVDLREVSGSGRQGRVTADDVERAASAIQEEKPEAPAISPRARRLAARLGIDWRQVRGSGRTGRIRERDVVATAPQQPGDRESPGAKVPLTTTRKTIAARMMASRRETAPVTLMAAVDAANLVNLREQYKSVARIEQSAVPSFTDFLVKLTGFAIQKHPLLGATWQEDGIQLPHRIDVGVAVDIESGLVVPVIRDVPALGLREVAARARDLIDRARRGQLTSREMEGGCFTITNLGSLGVDAFTPIINLPQCAILGVGRIERVPVMDGEKVMGRDRVTLSLTFDHRVIDGAPAARFLQTLAHMIETPGPWLST